MAFMKLARLFSTYRPVTIRGDDDLDITGLSTDSRTVTPGTAFIAIPGTSGDGSAYAADAVAKGAVAVICEPGALRDLSETVTRVEVTNPRIAAAMYAAEFYTPQPQRIVAVTGTDGKSSTVEFIRQILEHAGRKSASLGTIGITTSVPLPPYDAVNTTPDPVVLCQQLQLLAKAGVQDVALEASSHGLHQYRLEGLQPTVGVFTTFGQDHLDYHGTLEAYFDAKARLFREMLTAGSFAVLNADDARIIGLREACAVQGVHVLGFGLAGDAVQLLEVMPVTEGQRVRLKLNGTEWKGLIPLYGRFQVMNVLAASGAALGLGLTGEEIIDAYAHLKGVRGRLELAGRHAEGMPIFVDYAHTAQGLSSALDALRPHTGGRLHVVFGCGGDRDPGKRPEMGRVAAQKADVVIVTDDNPRTEDPAAIRRAVLEAAPHAREITDRRAAIAEAIAGLQPGDTLLIAGKGHETYQIIGREKHPFNDVEEVQNAVGTVAGMKAAI
jgi:UDP-N-acetylmuramoyl-L-alanyl-D-glutamate--2,6-diaminopimelate ligase